MRPRKTQGPPWHRHPQPLAGNLPGSADANDSESSRAQRPVKEVVIPNLACGVVFVLPGLALALLFVGGAAVPHDPIEGTLVPVSITDVMQGPFRVVPDLLLHRRVRDECL